VDPVDRPDGGEAVGLPGRPVVVGEVLLDHFPDGTRVLGGAPFNLAWHLQALGLEPLLITRVGADRDGAEALEAMARWGLDVSGVQLDRRHPTGAVRVRLDRGEPEFEIPPDQAWDHLEAGPALAVIEGRGLALLCHGSLVARAGPSRSALGTLRARAEVPVFVDVNLRDPFWSEAGVSDLLAGARWVKLNERELRLVEGSGADAAEAATRLRQRHALGQVWVTRGAAGALVAGAAGVVSGRHPAEVAVVDTVGAGDAFCAVVVAGLARGWSEARTLAAALDLAARVCTLRGATGTDLGLYRGLGEDLSTPRHEHGHASRAPMRPPFGAS